MRRISAIVRQIRSYSISIDRPIPPAKRKHVPTSGTYPKGFLLGTAYAGVKASDTKYDDVAMVVSEHPCSASAVFTRNIFKAAPVQVSQKIVTARMKTGGYRGVIVNSGCANAVTGTAGVADAVEMARATDACFGEANYDRESVQRSIENVDYDLSQSLVMSTGVIGQRLPMEKIKKAIPQAYQALGSTHEHWLKAGHAICTTDTFPKLVSRTFTLPSHPGTEYRIAGITKGAGMIHPNMGTLLAIVCTDALIENSAMKYFLSSAVNTTFNCISVDGDTSTNDTVALFANGAAAPSGVNAITLRTGSSMDPFEVQNQESSVKENMSEDARTFQKVLTSFLEDLAKLVVRDGEGATKFVTVRVESDVNIWVARHAASSIARSLLVKTALYGKDANWGRILCAIGYAPGIMNMPDWPVDKPRPVSSRKTSVSFIPADGSEALEVLVGGEPQEVDEARAKEILEMEDIEIFVQLRGESFSQKKFQAIYWTCDLSHDYVTINGDYRS